MSTRRPRSTVDQHLAELDLADLERRRAHIQAHIDAADIETTTPAQLNEWLATRVLLDRSIGRQSQALLISERNAQ